MINKEKILSMIDYIVDMCHNQTYTTGVTIIKNSVAAKKAEVITTSRLDEIYNLTLSLLTKIYGQTSDPVQNFQKQLSDYLNPKGHYDSLKILQLCIGKLNFLKVEINMDLLNTFEKEISGEIYGDLLVMSRESLEYGAKDTAAVLACAALEDALKKFAKINGLETNDKTMNEVSNALKSIGFLKGAQGSLMTSFIKIRNKAFHAEWDSIDTPDIKSLIAFTEEFISTNF